ncbi:MAG TPA: NADPH-dependent FMN reductase [Candidatus Methylacidiphilales bacterium]|nr:NADPH-dependent FMN reductase [Candidatus Methylacidiphilales bacterium]
MPESSSAEYLIIASSLKPVSFSRIMADALREAYETLAVSHRMIDLRRHTLPLCDGEAAYEHPQVATLTEIIEAARVIVIATPVYNFDANAAVKNLIELTGGAWENKVVGFLCAAGGVSSYMSIMALANSLMLDFRCLIVPRFVYAHSEDFDDERRPGSSLAERIRQLADTTLTIRNAV